MPDRLTTWPSTLPTNVASPLSVTGTQIPLATNATATARPTQLKSANATTSNGLWQASLSGQLLDWTRKPVTIDVLFAGPYGHEDNTTEGQSQHFLTVDSGFAVGTCYESDDDLDKARDSKDCSNSKKDQCNDNDAEKAQTEKYTGVAFASSTKPVQKVVGFSGAVRYIESDTALPPDADMKNNLDMSSFIHGYDVIKTDTTFSAFLMERVRLDQPLYRMTREDRHQLFHEAFFEFVNRSLSSPPAKLTSSQAVTRGLQALSHNELAHFSLGFATILEPPIPSSLTDLAPSFSSVTCLSMILDDRHEGMVNLPESLYALSTSMAIEVNSRLFKILLTMLKTSPDPWTDDTIRKALDDFVARLSTVQKWSEEYERSVEHVSTKRHRMDRARLRFLQLLLHPEVADIAATTESTVEHSRKGNDRRDQDPEDVISHPQSREHPCRPETRELFGRYSKLDFDRHEIATICVYAHRLALDLLIALFLGHADVPHTTSSIQSPSSKAEKRKSGVPSTRHSLRPNSYPSTQEQASDDFQTISRAREVRGPHRFTSLRDRMRRRSRSRSMDRRSWPHPSRHSWAG